jgi:hypothetical protein
LGFGDGAGAASPLAAKVYLFDLGIIPRDLGYIFVPAYYELVRLQEDCCNEIEDAVDVRIVGWRRRRQRRGR